MHVRIATLAIFRSPRDTSVEVVYGDIRCTRNYSFQIEENEKQIIIINYSSADEYMFLHYMGGGRDSSFDISKGRLITNYHQYLSAS